MKFAAVFALVAAATVVSAETNAQRFARGLPPNSPAKRATPVEAARRGAPSGTSGQCNTGTIQCCDSVGTSSTSDIVKELLDLFGVTNIDSSTLVGVSCSGSTSCTQQPVCCDNNSFNGLISIGCSPITINA